MRRSVAWAILVVGGLWVAFQFVSPPRPDPSLATPKRNPRFPVPGQAWKATLVTEAPRIRHPTVVTCAPDGRVFVGEDPMDMGGPDHAPVDRVVCVHPDGRVTVFATNLYCVFGLAYLDGKLYVNHAPMFSAFRDGGNQGLDRDDLLHYPNPRQTYLAARTHIPANLRLAMDGFFYLAVGDAGMYQARGRDGTVAHLQGGGVIRFRPDGTDLEVFARGTRNHPDLAINAEDEIFTYDNTDDGEGWWSRVTHMVDGGYYGYPFDYRPRRPDTLWMMGDYGPGGATGALTYNEDAWPPNFHGNLFLGDYTRSQVMQLRVSRDGGTFRIDERVMEGGLDFTTAGTEPFRPVGLAVSPDGLSLYVTDWGTHMALVQFEAGRLWKLTYTGRNGATKKPGWFEAAAMGRRFEATTQELIEGLKHPAQSVRLVAQRRLAQRGGEAIEALGSLLEDRSAPAAARWGAIWSLDGFPQGTKARAAIQAALRDPDDSVRRQAARQLGTRRAREAVPELITVLADTNASVRFHAATALGRIGDIAAISVLQRSLTDSDSFARFAAFVALRRVGLQHPESWTQIASGLKSGDSAIRDGTRFAVRDVFAAPLAKAVAELVAEGRQTAATRAAALSVLGELARQTAPWDGEWWGGWNGTQPVNQPRPARTMDWEATPLAVEKLRAGLAAAEPAIRRAAVDGLRYCQDSASASALRQRFAMESDLEVSQAILQALSDFKDEALGGILRGVVRDRARVDALRVTAIDAAARLGGPEMNQLLREAAAAELPREASVRVLQALGAARDDSAVPVLVPHLQNKDPQLRKTAVEALGSIGSERAVDALLPLLNDPALEARFEGMRALAATKSPRAVPSLLAAFGRSETRAAALLALAEIPDVRALDAYLIGLQNPQRFLRDLCLRALIPIRAEALPAIEDRLASQPLPPNLIVELQQLDNGFHVVDWFVAGPFAGTNHEQQLQNELPLAAAGKSRLWRRARGAPITGRIDLRSALGLEKAANRDHIYAGALVDLASPATVELTVACADLVELWQEGRRILSQADHEASRPAPARAVRTALARGTNVFMARVAPLTSGALSIRGSRPLDLSASPELYASHLRRRAGEAGRGRRLFASRELGCQRCHRVEGEGGQLGPDLTGIGLKYGREQLAEAVLFPSRQILNGYQQVTLTTDDGTVTGLVQAEDAASVRVVDAGGNALVVRKDQVRARRTSEVSLMPEDLHNGLSLEAFADLIAYLEQLRGRTQAAP